MLLCCGKKVGGHTSALMFGRDVSTAPRVLTCRTWNLLAALYLLSRWWRLMETVGFKGF